MAAGALGRPERRRETPPGVVLADAADEDTATVVTSPSASGVAASAAARQITALVLPYGVPGRLTQGAYRVTPGSVVVPDDLKRVKLLNRHRNDPAGATSVGHLVHAEHTAAGLACTFQLGTSPEATQALADAADHTRDAVSVELSEVMFSADAITGARLDAVALVDVPAFDDARVVTVTAHRRAPAAPPTPARKVPTMDPKALFQMLREAGLTDADARARVAEAYSQAEADALEAVDVPGEGDPAGDGDGDGDGDPAGDAGNGGNAGNAGNVSGSPAAAAVSASRRPARAPRGLTHIAQRPTELSFSAVMDTLISARLGDRSNAVFAALADITQTATMDTQNAKWLGELWSGGEYERNVVPLVTNTQLTSPTVTGWRWTTEPTIQPYAGNKTEIPTGPVGFEKISTEAKRLAFGNDIDRIHWDFGQTEIIESWFRKLAESYARVTDEIVADFISTNARAVTGAGSTGTPAPDMLRAAAIGARRVKIDARTSASFVLVNPEDMLTLLDFSKLDSPEFLDVLGIAPTRWVSSEFVDPGTVLVGTKQAVQYSELGSVPIRVLAEHVSHGGRDGAVFGYHAELLTSNKGLVKVAFGSAPVGG